MEKNWPQNESENEGPNLSKWQGGATVSRRSAADNDVLPHAVCFRRRGVRRTAESACSASTSEPLLAALRALRARRCTRRRGGSRGSATVQQQSTRSPAYDNATRRESVASNFATFGSFFCLVL